MGRNRILPPHVTAFVDRHGKERFRYRRAGYRTACLPPPGSADFAKAYEAAKLGIIVGAGRARPFSLADLLPRLYETNAFKRSGLDRQRAARGILEPLREEFGDQLVRTFKWPHIEKMLADRAVKRRDEKTGRMVGGTSASNNLKKELRRLFDLAVKLEWIRSNPVDHAEGVHHVRVGFHNWTEEEIEQYQAFHPVGTSARAALEIILWTGQRRGDASQFGPAHIQDGKIKFVPAKTARMQKVQWLAAPKPLMEAIKALPAIGTKTFLVTSFGRPFTKTGFGNKMREWCDEAGLPQCSAHGLRKAAARRVAENGGTQQELMAFGGWANDKDAAVYVRDANKAKMAESAIAKVVAFDREKRAENG